MATKLNRINRYIVVFDQPYIPGEDSEDVKTVVVEMYAKNVDDAKEKALKTVTLNPEKYEIVLIKNENREAADIDLRKAY